MTFTREDLVQLKDYLKEVESGGEEGYWNRLIPYLTVERVIALVERLEAAEYCAYLLSTHDLKESERNYLNDWHRTRE